MMTAVVNAFEAPGPTVPEKNTKTIQLQPSTRHPGPHRSSSKQQAKGVGRQCSFCTWEALSTRALTAFARDQATDPSRMGMLQTIQAGVVRYGDRPVHSEGAHAKGRGDGDPAAQACDEDSRPGAHAELRTAHCKLLLWIQMASSADSAPTTSCRTLRPSRRHKARASGRSSAVSAIFQIVWL